MGNDKDTQRLLVTLPRHLHRQAKILAATSGRSMADIVRELLEDEIKRQKAREQIGR